MVGLRLILLLLLATSIPLSKSAPQTGTLTDNLNDCEFLGALTGSVGADCQPHNKNSGSGSSVSGSCQCVPFTQCNDGSTGDLPVTSDGIPDLTNNPLIGIRGIPGDESNVIIDIGDRTISQCDALLDVCCNNIKPGENIPPPPPPIITSANQCGRRNTNGVGATIVGFQEGQAQLSEFPWMVAVLGPNDNYVGGGSLVHSRIVLTAAHKVHGFTDQLVARIGDWDLSGPTEPIPSQNRNVQQVLYHPKFNSKTLVYDVALLILEQDADLGDTVMPVCLPEVNQEFHGDNCTVTGWGKDAFGRDGKYQAIMKKVSVPAVGHRQCQDMLRATRLGPTFNLHDTFNCAGGHREGEDACEGDGGSPLVCPDPNNSGTYVQMGVVAWGIGCGQVGHPGVYGSIPKTVQWIKDTIQQEAGFDVRTPFVKKSSGVRLG